MGGSERRLAAIMFTDIVGYTTMVQENEATALKLLEEHRKVVRSTLALFGGKEVKTLGDGFLIKFGSAIQSIRFAFEIQKRFRKRNSRVEPGHQVWLRIGLHVGDVVEQRGDIVGDSVNLASRLVALSEPGGICMTQQVYDQVHRKLEIPISEFGRHRLKHVKETVQLYKVDFGERAEAEEFRERKRIAILPFSSISQHAEDEYFVDGMTEELISTLSQIEGLGVIARTSVMKYKGQQKRISEIGRELGVDVILEGSVRKAGPKLRIAAQLIDSKTEEHLWSQEYDRELTDVFAMQSDIAGRIAEAMRIEFLRETMVRLQSKSTKNLQSYELYLKGRFFWNKRTESDLKKAIRFFSASCRLDSSYAPSYSGLADSYSTLALLEFMPPRKAFPRAKVAAQKALKLNPKLADAHTSLGLIRFQYEWDWKGAEEEFKKAIELNPNYQFAHHFYADFLKARGRFDEALKEIGLAQELDPLSLSINTGVGHVLYLSGQYDNALDQYRRTVELDPNFLQARLWYGRPLLQKGMFREAISELQMAVKLSGRSTIALAMLGHAYASAGKRKEAEEILRELRALSTKKYVAPYWIAVVYNGMRDMERTFFWLRRALSERSSWLVWIGVEPRFSWLRRDLRFKEILESVGLK
ncbi:MAG: adenylate/guanylate cyclase domain-containing protein [Conexivisphaerales archaeon]